MSEADNVTTMSELIKDQKPKQSIWTQLCESFEKITDEAEIHHAAEQLEPLLAKDWTYSMRFTPARWIERLLEGDPLDWMIITRSLDLRGKRIGYVDADLLSQSPELLHIRHLNLAYNGLQNAGTRALISTDVVRNLTYLDLSGNSIEFGGIEAMVQCSYLSGLKHLDLTGNWVDDAAAKLIANCEHFSNLETLILRGNPVKQDGAEALSNSPYLNDSIKDKWKNP